MAKEIHEDSIEILTTAIVKRASDDIIEGFPYYDWPEEKKYRLLHDGTTRSARIREKIKNSCEAVIFLRSSWYQTMFPNINGEKIISVAMEIGRENVRRERERDKKRKQKLRIIKGRV